MDKSRREFLKGTAWMGAAAIAAGCVGDGLKLSGGGAAMASSIAAIGIGVGLLGAAAASLMAAISKMTAWQIAGTVVAIILVVSLPSVILTYFNLRKRDLGAVLNAGGWAVNREMRFSMKRARGFTKCVPPCRAGSGGSGHVTAISGK